MAIRFPRFERQVSPETGITNPLAGTDADILAAELDAFSRRRATEAAQAGAEAAFTRGQAAGNEQGLDAQQREPWNARARAFNAGVAAAQQAALTTDIRDQVSRIAIETPDDPDAFAARVEGLEQGLIQAAPVGMHAFITERVADYGGRAHTQILASRTQQVRAQAVDDLSRGTEALLEDAQRAAFEGDVLLLESRRQEVENLIGAAVEGGLLDAASAAAILTNVGRDITGQEVIGNFDRLVRDQGADAGLDAIARWQQTKPSEVGLSVAQHEEVTRQLIGLRNRQAGLEYDAAHLQMAETDAAEKAARSRVQDTIGVMTSGFAPQPEALQQAVQDLSLLGDADLAAQFDTAAAIQDEVLRFRRLPPGQRANELNRLEALMRTEGATPESVQLLSRLQQMDTQINQQLADDPRGYAERSGFVADAPLQFGTVDGFIESISARVDAGGVGDQLTGQPLPRLNADEASQLAHLYNTATIEEKVQILGAVTVGAGDDAQATLAQLDRTGASMMALVGNYVMQGDVGTRLARDILRGQEIIAADREIVPSRLDWEQQAAARWGTALNDWPEQRQTYIQAAQAKYAQLKQGKGDLTSEFDASLWRQALDSVMRVGAYNGRQVALPLGYTPGQFSDWTRGWTAQTFDGIAGGTGAEILAVARSRGRLIEAGDGLYALAIANDLDSIDRPLVRADGSLFLLHIRAPVTASPVAAAPAVPAIETLDTDALREEGAFYMDMRGVIRPLPAGQ